MSEQGLTDFLILRSLEEPITADELEAAGQQSGGALRARRDEGTEVRWVESEVMTTEDGRVTGTFCHYRAERADAIREHADRAGLPATRIDRRGCPSRGSERKKKRPVLLDVDLADCVEL